ncbi:MAG: hydantoinase B/oxoprolinase family protein [Alphaproteobacteria bacterium]|nr:hydantoinase B/oxoprolinase family protein [Alphaproteobacteria bacterium]
MDPIQTEIMKNRFAAIVEEGSTTVFRTAHTAFVKQTQDYQCALATTKGEIFAYPAMSGVTSFIGISLEATLDFIDPKTLGDGDVIITNDPFRTDGMCSHTMDIHLVKPIFFKGTLIAYGWSFLHASDIGGAVPGSISPTLTEVFQEGFRLRPMKLIVGGQVNSYVLSFMQDNSRIPEDLWGDLQALVAAMNTMERRLHELCDRLGASAVTGSMEDLIALGELRAREALRALPDGEYSFSDYLEGVNPSDLILIHVRMQVRDGTVHLDFSGSDPQVQMAVNFVTGSSTHPFLTQALNYFVLTQKPNTPANAGLVRPMSVSAPRGTVMNAEFPAAMGNRWVTAMRIYDCVVGCLNQALPGGIVSCGAGQAGIIAVSGRDPRTGKRRVGVVNPLCGGSGGRCTGDGVDGVDGPQGYLANTPIEMTEIETSVRVRRYELEPDSYAPGRWRSGAGITIELESADVETVVTVRGMNRFYFRPWGVNGGAAGSLGRVILKPDTPEARSIGKITVLTLHKGDVVRMISPSGGGFGDPLARPLDLIERDVRSGLLSAAKAAADYLVVFDGVAIDREATKALRAKRGAATAPAFAFGAEREAQDREWPIATRSAIAAAVRELPLSLRAHVLNRVLADAALARSMPDKAAIGALVKRTAEQVMR